MRYELGCCRHQWISAALNPVAIHFAPSHHKGHRASQQTVALDSAPSQFEEHRARLQTVAIHFAPSHHKGHRASLHTAASLPDGLHSVPFVLYKGSQCLDDGHEAGKGVLIPLQRPDGLASIAENEDVLPVLSPSL